MGILLAVDVGSWFRVVEGNQVTTADNQLAADLRLAHGSATNQLQSYEVRLPSNSSTYQIGPLGEALETRTLPDNMHTGNVGGLTVAVTFWADGQALVAPSGFSSTFQAGVTNGGPSHDVDVTTLTSNVRVDL